MWPGSVAAIDIDSQTSPMSEPRADSRSVISKICSACGMCCDGTLFTHVLFTPGEDAAAYPALGGVTPNGKPGFGLPCPEHEAGVGCRSYDLRPIQCGVYRCGLVKRFEQGELDPYRTLERIDSLVAEVRESLSDLNQAIAAAGVVPVRYPVQLVLRQFTQLIQQECLASEEADVRRRHSAGFLAFGRLRLLMNEPFGIRCD